MRFPPGDTIRVVSWNLRNLVDLHDDPRNPDPLESRPDTTELRARRLLIARALRELDAEVVVLQEVEDIALVEEMARRDFGDLGYRFFGAGDRVDWHQNVVVMSRLPLGPVRSLAPLHTRVTGAGEGDGSTQRINHRILMVDVLARPDRWFRLGALHLKAGTTEVDRATRQGQLEALAVQLRRAASLDPEVGTLVAGDFNATTDSDELALLLGAGPPIRFHDPAPEGGTRRRIDHLLIDDILREGWISGTGGQVSPLSTTEMRRISDHRPVKGRFILR